MCVCLCGCVGGGGGWDAFASIGTFYFLVVIVSDYTGYLST